MKHKDHMTVANAAHWEAEVKKGGGHTIPWLDLDPDQLHRYMRGDLGEERLVGRREPRRYMNMAPEDLSLVGGVSQFFLGVFLLVIALGAFGLWNTYGKSQPSPK